MKCKHCGETVRCHGCGAKVNSSQTLWARRRVRKGLCARCPAKLTRRDLLLEHVHCVDCRKKQAERSRLRYEKRGRKDRGGKAWAA